MAIISILSACVCIAYIKKTNIMNELLYVTFSFIMVLYLIAIGTNGNLIFLKALKISSTIFFIILIMLFMFFRKEDIFSTAKKLIKAPEIAFTLFSFCIILTFYNYHVIDWDDLNHWALFPKQIYSIGHIPINGESISNYSDYFPIQTFYFSWFESDFTVFHDNILFISQWFLISLNCSFIWNKFDFYDYKRNIILLFFSILLPIAVCNSAFINLKVDSLIALSFISVLILIIQNSIQNNNNIYKIFISICFLTMLKSVAIYISTVSLLIWVVLIYINRNFHSKAIITKNLIGVIITFITSFLLRASWTKFCIKNELSSYISEGFSGIQPIQYIDSLKALASTVPIYIIIGISLCICVFSYLYIKNSENILDKYWIIFMLIILFILTVWIYTKENHFNISHVLELKNNKIAFHYWNELSTKSLNFQYDENSNWGSSALVTFFLISIYYVIIRKKVDNIIAQNILITNLILLLGFIIYMSGHLALYLYLFDDEEVVILSAFSRYIMMYFSGFLAFPLYLSVLSSPSRNTANESKIKNNIHILMGGVILLCISNFHFSYICLTKNDDYIQKLENRSILTNDIYCLLKDSLENGDIILWIKNEDATWTSQEFRYYFCPNNILVDFRDDLNEEILDNTKFIISNSLIDKLDKYKKILSIDNYSLYSIE